METGGSNPKTHGSPPPLTLKIKNGSQGNKNMLRDSSNKLSDSQSDQSEAEPIMLKEDEPVNSTVASPYSMNKISSTESEAGNWTVVVKQSTCSSSNKRNKAHRSENPDTVAFESSFSSSYPRWKQKWSSNSSTNSEPQKLKQYDLIENILTKIECKKKQNSHNKSVRPHTSGSDVENDFCYENNYCDSSKTTSMSTFQSNQSIPNLLKDSMTFLNQAEADPVICKDERALVVGKTLPVSTPQTENYGVASSLTNIAVPIVTSKSIMEENKPLKDANVSNTIRKSLSPGPEQEEELAPLTSEPEISAYSDIPLESTVSEKMLFHEQIITLMSSQDPKKREKNVKAVNANKLDPTLLNFQAETIKLLRSNNYDKIQILLKDTLKAKQAENGDQLPLILDVKLHSVLADLLVQHGKLDEALELFSKSILRKESWMYEYYPNHENPIKTQECMASILVNQCKWDDAARLYKDIAERLKWTVGPKDLETIDAEHDYATMLHKGEKTAQAIPIYRKLLIKAKEVIGSKGKTLQIQFNLACALQAEEHFSEAYDWFEKVCQKRQSILGLIHPLTIQCQSRKAHILADKGKYEKSVELYQWVIENCSLLFGEGDRKTVKEKIKLVNTYVRCGRLKEALWLAQSISVSENEGIADLFIGRDERSFTLYGRFIEPINVFKPFLKKVSTSEFLGW